MKFKKRITMAWVSYPEMDKRKKRRLMRQVMKEQGVFEETYELAANYARSYKR